MNAAHQNQEFCESKMTYFYHTDGISNVKALEELAFEDIFLFFFFKVVQPALFSSSPSN